MELTMQLEQIVNAMLEAAEQSNINPDIMSEIRALKGNGFNTRDLFGIRGHEFIINRFEKLPLQQRINWFNSIAY